MRKGPQTRETETGIDVMLNYVKSKIVESAEAPDRNEEQRNDAPIRVLKNQQGRGTEPNHQE